jgi:hypothetical protein
MIASLSREYETYDCVMLPVIAAAVVFFHAYLLMHVVMVALFVVPEQFNAAYGGGSRNGG